MAHSKEVASIEYFEHSILCRGFWCIQTIENARSGMQNLPPIHTEAIVVDGHAIKNMDLAGAWLFKKLLKQLEETTKVQVVGLEKQFNDLIGSIEDPSLAVAKQKPAHIKWMHSLGETLYHKWLQFTAFMNFLGWLIITSMQFFRRKPPFSFNYLLGIIDEVGVCAMPITALLSFLIGIVLAYQMGLQLQLYGADIYIASLSGMAILREFAPLITAIIVAGRTSSSFTALLGMMKVNQEIDALVTMGVSTFGRLVLPRVLAVLVALPLLTFWADVFGIMGSMVMARSMLDISYQDFIHLLRRSIELQTYVIGLSKAPVFALIIAMIGCFQGLQVSAHAASVGRHTTMSVVQAVFLIIIADAIFSILFNWQGI